MRFLSNLLKPRKAPSDAAVPSQGPELRDDLEQSTATETSAGQAAEASPVEQQVIEPAAAEDTTDTSGQAQAQSSTEATHPEQPALAEEVVEEAAPVKASRWSKAVAKFKPRREDASRPVALPIRVVMGYLPEVTERDAREYAMGMAEKHFAQMGLVHFAAYAYDSGFVYEVHEGGDGRAYAPAIIDYFKSQGPYRPGENVKVHIRTGSRMVEVLRLRDGLACVILPEQSEVEETPWLRPTKTMSPGLHRRTGFFYAGVTILGSGLLAVLVSGMVFRLQPYEEPPAPKVEIIKARDLPRSQWPTLENLPAGTYVRALRFQGGRWEAPEMVTSQPAVAPSAAEAASAPGTPKN